MDVEGVSSSISGSAGPIACFANLLEAHSVTGRGVMQFFAVGRGMAELVHGGRFAEHDLGPLARSSAASRNTEVAKRLWDVSEQLTGVRFAL